MLALGIRALVVYSISDDEQLSYKQAHADPFGEAVKLWIDKLASLGTPLVTSSGNHGDYPGRKLIDQIPQVLEDENTHIINVGAVDFQGMRWKSSQDGPQITIHGPGVASEAQAKKDKTSIKVEGTSFSAPAVAGQIAVYMCSENPP